MSMFLGLIEALHFFFPLALWEYGSSRPYMPYPKIWYENYNSKDVPSQQPLVNFSLEEILEPGISSEIS